MESASALRQRHPVAPGDDEAKEGGAMTDLTWQLREARAALAERVKAQQALDGHEEQPWLIQARLERDRRSGEIKEEKQVEQMLHESLRSTVKTDEVDSAPLRAFDEPNPPNNVTFNESLSSASSAPLKPTPTTPSSFSTPITPVTESTARPEPNPEPATETGARPEEERTCRICFEGDDDPELGTLFSPCKCRGTAKYVHVVCLDRWRTTSSGRASAYKCDQCRYEYKLRRTRIAGLASNKFALTGITFLLLAIIIFLSGFVASFIIEVVDQRTASSGSIWDDYWVSDHVILGETVRTAVGFFEDKIDAFAGEESGRILPDQTSFWTGSTGRAPTARGSLHVDRSSPMWRRALAHTIKGFSLVGLLSFLQLSFSAAFLGPFGLRSSIFRMLNPRRGRRNDGRDGGFGIAEIVLVSFILVGIVKAVKQLYSLVHYVARKLLARFEVMIMEVQ